MTSTSKCILLVEDDDDHAEIVDFYAAELEAQVTVVRKKDGAEAIAWVESLRTSDDVEPPWLIVLDLNLPRYDGHEVLARLRAEPALDLVPVIVCSTSEATADFERALKAGANAFITKPSEPGGFGDMLESLFGFWAFSPHDRVEKRKRRATS